MPLRFKILSAEQVCTPGGLIIDEPVGWDAISMNLKRDQTWRGFFDFFDDSLGSLQFDFRDQPLPGGGQILQELYETYGIDAEATLLIEFQCGELDEWDELYRGRFVFSKYKFTCGDMCYVEIGLENVSCLMRFTNRYDQKVDLDSLETFDAGEGCETYNQVDVPVSNFGTIPAGKTLFGTGVFPAIEFGSYFCVSGSDFNDGTYRVVNYYELGGVFYIETDSQVINESKVNGVTFTFNVCIPFAPSLPIYDGLAKEITIPQKPLQQKSVFINPEVEEIKDISHSSNIGGCNRTGADPGDVLWSPNVDVLFAEINDTVAISDIVCKRSGAYPEDLDAYYESYDGYIFFNEVTGLQCNYPEVEVSIRLKGTMLSDTPIYANSFDYTTFFTRVLQDGTRVYNELGGGAISVPLHVGTANIDFDINDTFTISVQPGEKFYLQFAWLNIQYPSVGGGAIVDADLMTMNFSWEEFNMTVIANSMCPPTTAKVYMANESLSRITEAITNDCLRVKSDYFGRTDAEPYTSEINGCGGLEAITSGLKIRNAALADGTDPRMPISMKDLYEGLNAIHNIGMGIEPDTVRGGDSQWIRVEPVRYFFEDAVILVCDGVREIKREVDTAIIYSTFKTGYSKWETENTNGLYDLHGGREYRTKTSQVKNELNRVSDLIASDYAIEVTRRQFGKTTKDWKYDNDTFIVCLGNEWTGRIEFSNIFVPNSIVVPIVLQGLQVGDTFTISGTVANNGTFTISTITILNGLTYIVTVEAVVNESALNATIEGLSGLFYSVEQGNIEQDANILYPEYQYNYRITPARNAMRHLHTLGNQYQNCYEQEAKFTNGSGNIKAAGKLTTGCIIECQQVFENDNIELALFDFQNSYLPIHKPELIRFEYPLTYQQYKLITTGTTNNKPNYYGLIGYDCNGVIEYGWIEELKYQPYQGVAEFLIRPKKTCVEVGILSEAREQILDEENRESVFGDNQGLA